MVLLFNRLLFMLLWLLKSVGVKYWNWLLSFRRRVSYFWLLLLNSNFRYFLWRKHNFLFWLYVCLRNILMLITFKRLVKIYVGFWRYWVLIPSCSRRCWHFSFDLFDWWLALINTIVDTYSLNRDSFMACLNLFP